MISLAAPAKLTLTLRITGTRPDGYHLIDAEMVTLDLADRLVVDPEGSEVVTVRDGERHPAPTDDLVVRALDLVGRRAAVEIHKEIPPGAGLGGGSADAAAILRWAGELDPHRASLLGADVPFCLVGGRARVRGIGEVVEPLAPEPMVITLMTPRLHCSTPVVYRMWDAMGGPAGDNGNDLEPAALAAFPELAAHRDAFGEATGEQPRLAGSGSTWWVPGDHPGPGHLVVHTTGAA